MRTSELQLTCALLGPPNPVNGMVVSIEPLKVPEDFSSTRPPMTRPQTPPDVSSGVGLGKPATNALPCATNDVFMVPITELIALVAPKTPAIVGVKAPATF